MYSLAILAVVSCVLSLLLTPLWRNICLRLNLVDRPDGLRKRHLVPVPRVGGVPLMMAYLGSFVALLILNLSGSRILQHELGLSARIFPATALVFAVGLFDDLYSLRAWQKALVQTGAASLVFLSGVQLSHIAGLALPAWLSFPLTLLWLVGCSNAFNLIDGVDGLAAGAGLFATTTILIGALLAGNVPLALVTAPLAGALIGFLRYNFNPASIFLGDSGSLTIGFLLGCYAIMWSQKSATVLGMTAPLMALSLPLADTCIAIARRFLRRRPIMAPDARHIHHQLLARGMSSRRVALLLYGVCGMAACLSLLASVTENQFKGLVIVVFCGAAVIGVQQLGYWEFGVAGKMLIGGAFRGHLNSQLVLRAFEMQLASCATVEESWNVICGACRTFGFCRAELTIGARRFEESFDAAEYDACWNMNIPLNASADLRLMRSFNAATTPSVLVPFVEALHKNFPLPAEAKAYAASAGRS